MRWLLSPAACLSFTVAGPRAFAQALPAWIGEQSFDALKGDKHGNPCRVVFKADALELCDGQLVPRTGNVDYRYRNRTPTNNCNALGFFCSYFDHRFIIGWRSESDPARRSLTIVFRNTETAEQFNRVMARWSDRTPEEMSR
jgi:hypothetical protein